jgi:hypothetical protein
MMKNLDRLEPWMLEQRERVESLQEKTEPWQDKKEQSSEK